MGAVASHFWHIPTTPSKIVEIRDGKIQGKTFQFIQGSVNAFLGIPYAKQPVGELRFQKPQLPEAWEDVKQCVEFGNRCPHEELWLEKFNKVAEKGEDCLHLNVFAPDWAPESVGQPNGFAVLFWIHGGGFCVHSSSHYGDHGICEVLCTKNLVVVTINYRLGFFGFSVGDDIPSNLGLWDQTAALQWVHDNIRHFNGDPNNVTIVGQSAGGASVDFLTLSPHSNHLFKKAVPMGGSAMCSFALNDKEHVKQICLEFAKRQHGYVEGREHSSPFEFLRTLPALLLECGLFGSKSVNKNGKLDLTPVYDGDFFPKPYDELRREVPNKIIMTGITELEGLLFVGLKPARTHLHLEIHSLIERDIAHCKSKNVEEVKKKLYDLYMDGINPSHKKDMTKAAVKIVSDVFINNGAWNYADTMTSLGHTVYQYCFEYCNPNNFGLIGYMLPFKAATHGSELAYLFKKGVISRFSPSEDDLKIIEVFTTYFANFCIYDNPNGPPTALQHWKPLTPGDTLKYMSINLDKLRMCDNLNDGRPVVWRDLFDGEIPNGLTYEGDELMYEAKSQGKL